MLSDLKQRVDDSSEEQSTKALPVIEEVVHVTKQTVETGKVIAAKTIKEEVAEVSVSLNRDDVIIERIPIGKYIELEAPESRYEEDTLIIPIVKEELVIQKRLVLVEEIRITKRIAKSEFSERVTLRKEEIEIKEVSSNELKI